MLEQSFKQSFVNEEVSSGVDAPCFRAVVSIMGGSKPILHYAADCCYSCYLGLRKCGMAFEAKENRSPAAWKWRMAIFECRMGKSEGG